MNRLKLVLTFVAFVLPAAGADSAAGREPTGIERLPARITQPSKTSHKVDERLGRRAVRSNDLLGRAL